MTDIENLSVEELNGLINENKNKVIEFSNTNEQIDKDIAKIKQLQRDAIQKIPEIQEICRVRTETLEKIRRFQRKLLSIYTRFPGIIDSDSKHVISTDIPSLRRQLDNAKKRKSDAEKVIEQTKVVLEKLQQQKIEMVNEDNIQDDIMHQREQDKTILLKNLREELDSAKKSYITENREIEQCLNSSKIILSDGTPRLNQLVLQFQQNTKMRASNIGYVPPSAQGSCLQLQQIQQRVLKQTEDLLSWWASRRRMTHLTEQNKFLKECEQATEKRVDVSFSSIEGLAKNSAEKKKELDGTNEMIKELEGKIAASQQKEGDLKKELEKVKESFVPLPKAITDKLKKDREQYQERINEKKSLDIDYQILTDTSPKAARALNRLDKARRDYWDQIKQMVIKREAVEKLKKEIESKKNTKSNRNASLGLMQDPRIILNEDEHGKTVAAGPIEILTKIIFEPCNDDPVYPYAYLVLIHTIKSDIPTIVKMIVSAYDSGDYTETRQERVKSLLDAWYDWFKVDFPQVQQLVSLVGWVKGTDFQINDSFEFDDTIDIDMGTDVAFSSTPYTIAQHLAYTELQILYSIPAHEFIGTGWSKPDKWLIAPNIMKMTEHFNTITNFIISSILQKINPEERAQLIERWVEIMFCAKEILDFQSVFQIYGALCNPAIARLSKTWALVSKETSANLDKMGEFTSPMKQFHFYKEALKVSPVTLSIPYIGPMLTNLVYTHDGNQSKRKLPGSGEEVINFSKYRIYANIMFQIMKPWGRDCRFILSKKLLMKIKQIPPPDLSDTEAYQLSTKLE